MICGRRFHLDSRCSRRRFVPEPQIDVPHDIKRATEQDRSHRILDQNTAAVARNALASTARILNSRFQVLQSSSRKPIHAVTPASAASGTWEISAAP